MTTGLRSSYKLSERHVSSSSAPYNSRSFVSSAPGATSSAASQSSSSSSSLHSSSSTSSSSSSVAALRSRLPKRSVTPTSRSHSASRDRDDEDAGRVRVAVRLRPKKSDEIIADADFADCVELHPEMKRLKLRKNNWSSESYKFDEVFTDAASQRRVYEVVAKPVVESVLHGYNGTIMAYGQTGTGKTYTVGRLGKEDASERGIMVRALEDIIAETSSSPDCTVEVSYVQLYMESVQDLLAPETTNIPISEDPKTGEVSLPGASVVKIQDVDHFSQILYVGEENRHATNTKLNTESSRSHAILMVYVRRHKCGSTQNESSSQERDSEDGKSNGSTMPTVRKSKLLIVDLAGSERIDKSGSEGHTLEEAKFINLSLTSLGKCINAVAENSPHIPTRDSKLTRLLRDSFGGSARTSLIITIGPSASSRAETTSTIMFGQRAMRIVNMLKLKEEFDYESLCRELQNKLDHLTAELERQQKLSDNSKEELEKLKECETSFVETETKLVIRSELLEKEKAHLESEMKILLDEMSHQKELNVMMCDKVTQLEINLTQSMQHQHENSSYQKVLADTTQMYEKKISELLKQIEDERSFSESVEEQVHVMKQLLSDHQKSIQQYQTDITTYRKELAVTTKSYEKKIAVLMEQLDNEHARFEGAEEQLTLAQNLLRDYENSMQDQQEFSEARAKLQDNQQLQENSFSELQSLRSGYKDLLSEKEHLDEELHATKQKLASEEKQRKAIETELIKLKKSILDNGTKIEDKRSYMTEDVAKATLKQLSSYKSSHSRETLTGQKATIAKICEEVGLQKILAFLSSEDLDVQTHAVKVVANLAAEDINQEKIVEEGGLDALLNLLQSSQNTTILRVASGAIANLAMSELNQGLIMSKGGGRLLADTSSKTNDPQTLRMVAGAIANLCGNESLHSMLQEEGGIKALLKMAASGNTDVIAQVARGLANFAKCESRGTIQGHRAGPSLLMEDGVISWLIANSNTTSSSTRRHIELALCHLAQNEDNARDFQFSGGMKELERISKESTRDDIRSLAKKTLKLNSFQGRSNSAWA